MDNGHTDEDSRKLFLGGLAPTATKEDLLNYFGQYGEVQMATVKTDANTGRSRGFGFLIFKDVSSVNGALSVKSHEIKGKELEAKLATPQTGSGEKLNKVFVGGIDKSVTKEQLTDLFSQRGKVTDVFVPVDRDTQEGKGFAFVTFEDTAVPSQLCQEAKVDVFGKMLTRS